MANIMRHRRIIGIVILCSALVGGSQHCVASPPLIGQLIKPAKWKWPWQKQEKSIKGDDPFSDLGSDQQRQLASEISGKPILSDPMSPIATQAPKVKVTNGYEALPNGAGYPWPAPADSRDRTYTPGPGQLYANTANPAMNPPPATQPYATQAASNVGGGNLYPNTGVPDTIVRPGRVVDGQVVEGSATRQPLVTPARQPADLYPRQRVAGTSVTTPKTNPAADWAKRSGTNQNGAPNNGSNTRVANNGTTSQSSANGGDLYENRSGNPSSLQPGGQYPLGLRNSQGGVALNSVSNQVPPLPSPQSVITNASVVPNYARPKERMRVTTISPRSLANEHANLLANENVTVSTNESATVSATGRIPDPVEGLYENGQPPSASLSNLPGRVYSPIQTEPSIPKRRLDQQSQMRSPASLGSGTIRVASPDRNLARVSASATGKPAATTAAATGPAGQQVGPYFNPEVNPHYDDQYGWQRGTRQSSRKKWGGPNKPTAKASQASVNVDRQPISPAPQRLSAALPLPPIVQESAAVESAMNMGANPAADLMRNEPDSGSIRAQVEQAVGTPQNDTSSSSSPSNVQPSSGSGSLPDLPLPPLSQKETPKPNVESFPLPLPPLSPKVNAVADSVEGAANAVRAAVGTELDNVGSQVQQAAHEFTNQVADTANRVAQAVNQSPIVAGSAVGLGSASLPIPQTLKTPSANPIATQIANSAALGAQQIKTAATDASRVVQAAGESALVEMTSPFPFEEPARNATAGYGTSLQAQVQPIIIPGNLPGLTSPTIPPATSPVSPIAPTAPTTRIPQPPSAGSIGRVTSPPPAAPSLDGKFHSNEMDQSIWGRQHQNPGIQQGLQVVSDLPVAPPNAAIASPPRTNPTIQANATEAVDAVNLPGVGAAPNTGTPGNLDQASRVVAVIGDQSILAGDLLWQINQMLKPYIGQVPESALEEQRLLLMEKMLPRLIENKLVYLDFLRTIPREKLPEIRQSIIKEFNSSELPDLMKKAKVQTPAQMDAKLRKLGSSLGKQQQMFIEQIVGRQMVQQNVDVKSEVTHDELLEYYHAHPEEFDITGRARWQRIMVRWSEFPNREAAEKKLSEMGNEVLRGATFDEVAKRGSQGPMASTGGFHDWTVKGDLKSDEMEKLIFSLPIGKMSKKFRDDTGVHILRVIERRDSGRTPFVDVQTKITESIQKERFSKQVDKYLSKLRQETHVWTTFADKGPAR